MKEPIDGLILSNSTRLATTGLAKTLSRELGAFGITVNNVGPGTTMTDRIRPMIEAQATAQGRSFDEVRREREQSIPLGRIGEPGRRRGNGRLPRLEAGAPDQRPDDPRRRRRDPRAVGEEQSAISSQRRPVARAFRRARACYGGITRIIHLRAPVVMPTSAPPR